MQKEAEALPIDSPLRQHLIGEQADRTYTTTEGTGRRKRKVTRTYTPKTPFQQQVSTARDSLERTTATMEATQAKLAAMQEVVDEAERLRSEREKAAHEFDQREWRLGWTGDPHRLPPRTEQAQMPVGWVR
jgi:uncharacterized protein YhaN